MDKLKENNSALPFSVKLGYGMAEFSSTLTWTLISVVYLIFLTDVVGIKAAYAGTILMVGTLWDAVSDPAVGILSDSIKSRRGRRRPFLLAVALPFGLITWLLFTAPGFNNIGKIIYFCIAIVCYYTAATVLDVPYTALGAEMTQDYDERTSLNGYRAVFSQIAAIVAAGIPWVFAAWCTEIMGNSKQAGWSLMAGIFGIVAIFPILITWFTSRGRELTEIQVSIHPKEILSGPLKNRSFLYTLAMYAAGSIALSSAGAVMIYFIKYYMNFNEDQQSLAFIFLFATTFVWIPAVYWVSKKFGKRESFIFFIGLWGLIQTVGVILITPDMEIAFYIMMALAAAGVLSMSMTTWAMIPDVIEVDELKTGKRREGLFFGVISFFRKISVAVAIFAIGLVLSAVGYTPEQTQSDTSLLGIRLLYSLGVGFFLFLSVFLAYLLPITRKRHEALKEAINRKNTGQPFDESVFKDLL